MSASDAPTSALGGISDLNAGWGYPVDRLEHIPDLTWPQSITTLARMRTDPTLASVLAAYTTPLLAADWRIDPRGASEECVRICADSLGIPVQGEQEPTPGPVRRRGVEWTEHVRLAALHLVWGHFGFEPVYELRDGKAYLLALPERLPNTIVDIRVNPDGSLKSIVQEGLAGQRTNLSGGVEIPAERLLWYTHQREGAVWQGRSLLRAAYSNWLLKLDTLRVNAIGIARFGAGTPVAEPLPGTNPTPAQIAQAQQMVSSWRVGETGGAVPVGFKPRILGIEGTLPDAMPTLRYYDEQMARATLTSLLDLGSTSNGSRALGSEFADVMARSLQGVADGMAKTATQLCEKLTTYNFGDNAPVPAVIVNDVGASKATIAASIVQLVECGALRADAALESFIRDAYELPPSDGHPYLAVSTSQRGMPTLVQPDQPAPAPAVDAPAEPALKVAAAEGQWPGKGRVHAAAHLDQRTYREPTPAEQQAGLDPEAIDQDHSALTAALTAALTGAVAAWGAALVAQITAALTAGTLAALARLRITRTDTAQAAVLAAMRQAWAAGAQHVLDETQESRGGVDIEPGELEPPARLDAEAEALVVQAAAGMEAAAGREALRLEGGGGSPQDVAEQAVEAAATAPTSPSGPRSPLVEQAITRAMGGGRVMAMQKVIDATPDIDWVIFHSAIRDEATCPACLAHDQHVYPDLADGRRDFPGGNYIACEGRTRCRCLLAMRPSDAPTPGSN